LTSGPLYSLFKKWKLGKGRTDGYSPWTGDPVIEMCHCPFPPGQKTQ